MKDQLNQVPVEADAKIISQKAIEIGGHDALYQTWLRGGVVGDSIIFVTEHVAHLNKQGIYQLITDHHDIDDVEMMSLKQLKSGYTVVSCNFRSAL